MAFMAPYSEWGSRGTVCRVVSGSPPMSWAVSGRRSVLVPCALPVLKLLAHRLTRGWTLTGAQTARARPRGRRAAPPQAKKVLLGGRGAPPHVNRTPLGRTRESAPGEQPNVIHARHSLPLA